MRKLWGILGILLTFSAILAACQGVNRPQEPPAISRQATPGTPVATPHSTPPPVVATLEPPAVRAATPRSSSTPESGGAASRGSISVSPALQSPAEWTFFIYMAADNNLERFALLNLEQMASVGSTEKVNVLVQADRGAGDNVDRGVLNLSDWSTTKRLFVEKGAFKELADLGQTNMADQSVLKDFIAWGKGAYPAKRYGLVLWDHGGAWQGFATDDSSGQESLMSLPDLAAALKDSGITFEFLGFDACLMASAEVALELQPYARVLAASEELEPGLGWDYSAFLGALVRDPSIGTLDLGRVLADSYISGLKKKAARQSLYSTLSIVDLTQVPDVGSALSEFGAAIARYVGAGSQSNSAEQLTRLGQVIGRARYDTPAFGRQTLTDPGLAFDLGLLAENTVKTIKDEQIARSAAGLKAALGKAVQYKVAGDGLKANELSGLSLYLPAGKDVAEKGGRIYAKLPATAKTGWTEVIGKFVEAAASDKKPPIVSQPMPDTVTIMPGQNQAKITGKVTDENIVTGVVVGVVALTKEPQVLFSFEEQPRTYSRDNSYSYTFDGTAWYLDDGKESQPVFTVQWRPGQRAVFGSYQQGAKSKPTTAYFTYDETTGEMIEGFEVVGGALGALLPGDASQFQPFLYTPKLERFQSKAVPIVGARLKKGPLPDGEYLVTITGFDIGSNAATSGVIIQVRRQGTTSPVPAPLTSACQPNDIDAAGTFGEHNARFDLPSLGTLELGLPVDRYRVGQVRHVVDVMGGDGIVDLKLVGPDGRTVGASGRVSGHAADVFQPQISGLYRLVVTDKTGGPKTVFLTWNISPRTGFDAADLLKRMVNLDKNPELVDLFEQPGQHAGIFKVPAGRALTLSLNLDRAKTPWVGYSITLDSGPGSLPVAVLGPDKSGLDQGSLCGIPHSGGFQVVQNGEYLFIFDNRQTNSDQFVTISMEGYSPGESRATPAANLPLTGWCVGENSQDFTVPPGQVLRLAITCNVAGASRVNFNLTRLQGMVPLKYQVISTGGKPLLTGSHDYMVQETFAISSTGQYVIVLDNTANTVEKKVKLTLSVKGPAGPVTAAPITPTIPPPQPVIPPASPTPTSIVPPPAEVQPTPGPSSAPPQAPTPAAAPPIVQTLANWAIGDHSEDFTVGPNQVLWLVIPADSTQVSRSDLVLYQGSGLRYQVLAPDGAVLLSDRHGFQTQESFSINNSGDYVIVLDNSSNASSRTVKVSLYVKSR